MDAVTEPASSTSATLSGASPSAGDNRLGDTTGSGGTSSIFRFQFSNACHYANVNSTAEKAKYLYSAKC